MAKGKKRRGPAKRTKAQSLSPLGSTAKLSSDPRPVSKLPWFKTRVVMNLAAGGGNVPISQVCANLQKQLNLECVDQANFALSFHRIDIYTASYTPGGIGVAGVLPTLTASISTMLNQTSGDSANIPITTARTISDVGTPTMPAKIGFKWGVLGRTPQVGSSALNLVDILAFEDVDLYVSLAWTTAGYLTYRSSTLAEMRPVLERPLRRAPSVVAEDSLENLDYSLFSNNCYISSAPGSRLRET